MKNFRVALMEVSTPKSEGKQASDAQKVFGVDTSINQKILQRFPKSLNLCFLVETQIMNIVPFETVQSV